MRVRFTNTDSAGNPVTQTDVVTIDGERHVIDVAGTSTARVPRAVGEHLVDSPDHAVEPYDADTDMED